jgi:hypothetical protein
MTEEDPELPLGLYIHSYMTMQATLSLIGIRMQHQRMSRAELASLTSYEKVTKVKILLLIKICMLCALYHYRKSPN